MLRLTRGLVPGVLALGLYSEIAFAQTQPGLAITKTCPTVIPPNVLFTCIFTIQNIDPANAVNDLAVTDTVPFPGGTPVPVPCMYLGTPVTTLQPFGNQGDTCSGTVEETAACGDTVLINLIAATGTATDGHVVSGAGTGSVRVLACPPPPPTNTPTSTPTNTPTNSPTSSPASTPTATPVLAPTLSSPILAVFGLALAFVSLLFIRKSA